MRNQQKKREIIVNIVLILKRIIMWKRVIILPQKGNKILPFIFIEWQSGHDHCYHDRSLVD